MAVLPSTVDGLGLDNDNGQPAYPGVLSGFKLKVIGQAGNTVAGDTTNQQAGTVALPALSAGAVGTVTITNSLITSKSLIFITLSRGTTTASAGAVATVLVQSRLPGNGSCIMDLYNAGSAATLSTDVIMWYLIIN